MSTLNEFTEMANGDHLAKGYFNGIYKALSPVIYTGSGYDSAQSGAGTDEQSAEIATITSTDLVGLNYLVINVLGTATAYSYDGGPSEISIKIQTKDVGGSYSDSLPYVLRLRNNFSTNNGVSQSTETSSFIYIHTLTDDEKSAGITINMFSKSAIANATQFGSYVNIQTSIEGRA